jgi:hypothetical protein
LEDFLKHTRLCFDWISSQHSPNVLCNSTNVCSKPGSDDPTAVCGGMNCAAFAELAAEHGERVLRA